MNWPGRPEEPIFMSYVYISVRIYLYAMHVGGCGTHNETVPAGRLLRHRSTREGRRDASRRMCGAYIHT